MECVFEDCVKGWQRGDRVSDADNLEVVWNYPMGS